MIGTKNLEKKQSELYKIAQRIVLNTDDVDGDVRLEILRLLMNDEESAAYMEKVEAEKEVGGQ